MIAFLSGLIGLTTAVFIWWISPSQAKARLQKELQSIRKKIEEVKYESDQALAYRRSDELTRLHAELDRLRKVEASILQRLG